jgi:hypothetical protein
MVNTNLNLQRLDPLRVQSPRGKTKVRQLYVACAINKEVLYRTYGQSGQQQETVVMPHLRFQIPMDVAELMKLIDRCKHLRNVIPGMLLF